MRVNVERLPGSAVELDIFADDVEFADAVDKAYRKIAREVTIPGFRRGKAPRALIEKMVGREAVVEEAGQDMMDDLYRRAMEQEGLMPVGNPRVGILQPEPLGFKVVVEVFPTVELGDYQAVRVEPREVELDEAEVEEVIENLRKQHAEWRELSEERAPRDGDQITLDIDVFEGDEPFQEPARDATFVLGDTPLFDSLVEAIKMMPVGSSAELTLAFDEDDETVAPTLRGKELRYAITLKGVQERDLPAFDDELAQKVGAQYATADALRAAIEKDLLRNKAMQARGEVATEVINAMAETATIDVPASMVDREIDDELTQFRSRLAQQRLTLEEYLDQNDQTEEDLRAEIRPNAERRVRNSLVLQEIAKAEGLEITDEDIAAEIERLSAPAQNPERLRQMYQSDYFRGLLESELYDRKLTDFVLQIATEGKGAVVGAGAAALEEELGTFEIEPATAQADGEADSDAAATDDEAPASDDLTASDAETADAAEAPVVEDEGDDESPATEDAPAAERAEA